MVSVMQTTAYLAVMFSFAAFSSVAAGKVAEPLISPLILIPDSNHPVNEVREIGYGEAVFSGRVVLSEAAIPSQTSLELAGLHLELSSDQFLRRAYLPANDARAPAGSLIYCSSFISLSNDLRKPPESRKRGVRFRSTIRYCLLDGDADKKFDHGFIAGAQWIEDQGLLTIPALPFRVDRNVALPNRGEFALIFAKQAPLADSELIPTTDMLDGQRRSATINLGDSGEGYWTNMSTSVTPGALPKTITYGDGVATILSMDKVSRRLKFRIDNPMSSTKIGFNIVTGKSTLIGSSMISSNSIYTFIY